jgi:predicted lipid-binding transport protein (Tim44 family)
LIARKAPFMEKIDLFTLISLIVAVVVILKLRSVLGRRTGDEEARVERYRAERAQRGAAASPTDNVVAMPRRERDTVAPAPVAEVTQADAEERIKTYPSVEAGARNGLIDIARLDPAFDPDTFIRGAKQAYEMIVTAFAEGNRKLLKDLLSRDVYEGFTRAITDRESRGEQVDQSFVGIDKAEIMESEVKSGIASITVRFVSQLISATRDKAGAIINGDPQRIKEVTDIWTFSRDVSSAKARSNPNWRLIATQSPA